jgi:hypothetical protein
MSYRYIVHPLEAASESSTSVQCQNMDFINLSCRPRTAPFPNITLTYDCNILHYVSRFFTFYIQSTNYIQTFCIVLCLQSSFYKALVRCCDSYEVHNAGITYAKQSGKYTYPAQTYAVIYIFNVDIY